MTLVVKDLNVAYGDTQVLWDINISVAKGEVIALVGSNGAGKTTLLRTISGLNRPKSGQISINGQDLTQATPAQRVRLGVAHVPEGRQLFAGLEVRENILIGAYLRTAGQEVRRDLDFMFETFPEVAARRNQQAGTLSGGEQQMVALARGLMSRPQVLLIDELSLGLAPVVVEKLFNLIRNVQKELGIGVLVVEQDVEMAFEMADRGYILDTGMIVKEGRGEELLGDDAIRKAYLGI